MFQLYTRPTLALRLQDHQPFQELTYLETNQESQKMTAISWVCYFSKKKLCKTGKHCLYILVTSLCCLELYISTFLKMFNTFLPQFLNINLLFSKTCEPKTNHRPYTFTKMLGYIYQKKSETSFQISNYWSCSFLWLSREV
jgi:hypothetical protein